MKEQSYIILGLTAQGLALLRELGKAKADVTAFYTSKKNVGVHSKYGKRIYYHDIPELRQYIDHIISENNHKPICYITSGEILATVLRDFNDLYEKCDVYSGPYPIVEMLAHKDRMYEYATKKGHNVARYATLDKYRDGSLKFPIFLKRNYEIPLFFKAVKVNDSNELSDYINRIPAENLKDVIAQEYIDIPASDLINISCQGFFVNGECAGLLATNQLRRLRKGITSYIIELTDEFLSSKVKAISADFMKDLKYSGFAEFEYMYNSMTKQLFFIEVNTRTCGLQSALHHKFKNISEVLLMPDKLIKLEPQVNHLQWMNIQRDIRARIESKNFQKPLDIFKSKYDIFCWNDIKPFLRQIF